MIFTKNGKMVWVKIWFWVTTSPPSMVKDHTFALFNFTLIHFILFLGLLDNIAHSLWRYLSKADAKGSHTKSWIMLPLAPVPALVNFQPVICMKAWLHLSYWFSKLPDKGSVRVVCRWTFGENSLNLSEYSLYCSRMCLWPLSLIVYSWTAVAWCPWVGHRRNVSSDIWHWHWCVSKL